MAKQTFTTGSVLTATQMNNLQANDYNWSVNGQTASYVLVAADAGKRVEMNAAGSTTVTVNTGLFTAGDSVIIQNVGAGTCTVTAGTATVNKATNASLALAQYQGGTLYFVSASSAIFFPFDVGSSSAAYKGVSLSNTAAWTLSSGSYTSFTYDTEVFDTDGFHSTSSNTSRITIPTGLGGKYLLVSQVYFNANATGIRAIRFWKNNAGYLNIFQFGATPLAATAPSLALSFVADLVAGDYVELQGYQTSGGNLDVNAVNHHFSATYLGA